MSLGENPTNVHNVGNLSCENISKTNLLNKKQLEKNLKLNLTRKASYLHIIQLQMIQKQQEKN